MQTTPRQRKRLGGAALLVALGLLISGLLAGPAAAAVNLVPVRGPAVKVDPALLEIAPDVNQQNYTLRSEGGSRTVTVTGYSLAALLEAGNLDPVVIGYLEIARPGGGTLLLSRRQVTNPAAFPEGPPVVYTDESGTHLLRPSADDGDHNEADLITVAPGAELNITARSGTLLALDASSSHKKARVGQRVKFTATLKQGAPGETVNYSWYFDDGSSAEGAGTQHAFKQAGTYDVVVGVTTTGDRVGASATVTVQVGTPIKGGPNRKGGGNNRNTKAPDSGAANGAQGGADGGPGSGGSGPSSGPAQSFPTESAPAYSPPVSPAPTPTPAPAPPPMPAPDPEPEPEPRIPTGDEISGQLLADSQVAAEVLEPEDLVATQPPDSETVAARTGNPKNEGGGGIPGVVMGFGVTFLMLAGGGLLEARGIGRLRW